MHGLQWFIYNFGLMGPETRCFQYQWVPTANLWVQNTIFNDNSAILLHHVTRWNKNLCAKDAGCAGNKTTGSTSMLLLLHSAFMLRVVKLLLKGEVGDCALNSHWNYIVDHGKILELCFWISVGTLYNLSSLLDTGLIQENLLLTHLLFVM